MKVTKEKAVKMFVDLGRKTAGNWSTKVLQKKCNELPTLLGEDGDEVEAETKASAKLAQEMCEALANDDEIVITEKSEKKDKKEKPAKSKKPAKKGKKASKDDDDDDEDEDDEDEDDEDDEDEDDEDEKPSKKSKAKKGKKSKAKKGKKSKVKKDKWGYREGSKCSEINAVIGKKAKSAADIAEESDAAISLVRSHLRSLQEKELVEKTDKGYKAA